MIQSRLRHAWFLAALVICGAVSQAESQEQPENNGAPAEFEDPFLLPPRTYPFPETREFGVDGGQKLGLLGFPEVREELGFSEQQWAALSRVEKRLHEDLVELAYSSIRASISDAAGFLQLSKEEQRTMLARESQESERHRQQREKIRQKALNEVDEILSPNQIARWKQIQYQLVAREFRPVAYREVARILEISEAQATALQSMFDDLSRKSDEAHFQRHRSGHPMDAEWERRLGEELLKECRARANRILTAEQQAKLDELVGKPFEMPRRFRESGGAHETILTGRMVTRPKDDLYDGYRPCGPIGAPDMRPVQ